MALTFRRLSSDQGVGSAAKNVQIEHLMATLTTAGSRRNAISEYQQEVLQKTGKGLSKKAIWKAAGYTAPTQFERWQRADENASDASHRTFCRILSEKPHLPSIR
jgi:hypothetical protein